MGLERLASQDAAMQVLEGIKGSLSTLSPISSPL